MSGDDVRKRLDVTDLGALIRSLPGPLLIDNGLSDFSGREMIEITPAARKGRATRATRAAFGADVLKHRTARRIDRTLALTNGRRTNREIGAIIGDEEGVEAFAPHTVSAWRKRGMAKP